MDNETRAELERLHERTNNLRERVINLEAQQPHFAAALERIEKMVERLNGHLVKAIWIVIAAVMAALLGSILKGGSNEAMSPKVMGVAAYVQDVDLQHGGGGYPRSSGDHPGCRV